MYIPTISDNDNGLIILSSLFDTDSCLDYADKHNMDVLFTETGSSSLASTVMAFQKKGYRCIFHEKEVTAPDGTKLSPKILVRFTKTSESATVQEKKDNPMKIKPLQTLDPGETFWLGTHNFVVLEQMKDQTKIISKEFMGKNKIFGIDSNYDKSTLKRLIEQEFQPIIEQEAGAPNLVEHEVDLSTVDNQKGFGRCKCKARPITFNEARRYNRLLPGFADVYPGWYWTCTPWSTEERGRGDSVAVVSTNGSIDYSDCLSVRDIRIVCILKSNILVTINPM